MILIIQRGPEKVTIKQDSFSLTSQWSTPLDVARAGLAGISMAGECGWEGRKAFKTRLIVFAGCLYNKSWSIMKSHAVCF
jgi:hypothetical protein